MAMEIPKGMEKKIKKVKRAIKSVEEAIAEFEKDDVYNPEEHTHSAKDDLETAKTFLRAAIVDSIIKKAPPDDPIYKRGFVVGWKSASHFPKPVKDQDGDNNLGRPDENETPEDM